MDKVARTFDAWAVNGSAERMEREHGRNVARFLGRIRWSDDFAFADVGCGNGWTVRRVARHKKCRSATGLDKSKNMVMRARKKAVSKKETYVHADIESWKTGKRFDYIFAMESIYYSASVEGALQKIFALLKPGGVFFCGTDFYADNRATAGWPDRMRLEMHLYSKREWARLFKDAGFRTRTRQIRDPESAAKWKREFGTLFLAGRKA